MSPIKGGAFIFSALISVCLRVQFLFLTNSKKQCYILKENVEAHDKLQKERAKLLHRQHAIEEHLRKGQILTEEEEVHAHLCVEEEI